MPRTPKVFLDANILFAAAYSSRGGSREIIRKGIAGELVITVSATVLNEAGADYFVTLDKKHFLKDPRIGRKAKLKILSPRQFLKEN